MKKEADKITLALRRKLQCKHFNEYIKLKDVENGNLIASNIRFKLVFYISYKPFQSLDFLFNRLYNYLQRRIYIRFNSLRNYLSVPKMLKIFKI